MMQTPWLERRISVLISAYADGAPVAVDALAVARLAAASSRRRWWSTPADRGLVLVGAAVLLIVAITVGALAVGADPFRRDSEDVLRGGFIEPFVGLAPEGAPVRSPETGELVVSFYGRVNAIGMDFHRMWLYADGRLIWVRNLDWRTDPNPGRARGAEVVSRRAFGGTEPTIAVIEQRLTPLGVDLLRSEVMATAHIGELIRSDADATSNSPGVLWGGLTVEIANQPFSATWSDPALPGRLADPASWLPPEAWADKHIAGYVPARYAYCYYAAVDPLLALEALPARARALLSASATQPGGDGPDCRYRLSPNDARALSAALQDAGMVQEQGRRSVGYRVTEPGRPDGAFFTVYLLPVLPDGDLVGEGG